MNVCSQQYLTVRRGGWRGPHIHDDFLVYGPLFHPREKLGLGARRDADGR